MLTELSELKSSYGTLSYQVENFKATAGNNQITLSWTNPNPSGQVSNFSKVMIRRKVESKVTGPSDGVEIYSGTGTSYVDTGLSTGTTYHYRAFAMNEQDEPQTAECSVSMISQIQYSWEKFNAEKDYYYSVTEISYTTLGIDDGKTYAGISYSINSNTGVITLNNLTRYDVDSNRSSTYSGLVGKYVFEDYFYDENSQSTPFFYHLLSIDRIGRETVYFDVEKRHVTDWVYNYIKGSTSYGIVTSFDKSSYPMNGERDGYWYVFIG